VGCASVLAELLVLNKECMIDRQLTSNDTTHQCQWQHQTVSKYTE